MRKATAMAAIRTQYHQVLSPPCDIVLITVDSTTGVVVIAAVVVVVVVVVVVAVVVVVGKGQWGGA